MAEQKVDVFIAGAGPVGLVVAYQLRRQGLSVMIVDADDKASPDFPMYGRACIIFPRTIEMLDQVDLFDDLAQVGLFNDKAFSYRNGERIDRLKNFFDETGPSIFPQFMSLRLKYSEDVFRSKLEELDTAVQAPITVVDFRLDPAVADDYKVSVDCKDGQGQPLRVRAKYILGTDGGHSTVRKIAQIPFERDQAMVSHWVRIDGMAKTNVPEDRSYFGQFDSDTYGSVLWAPLDHGAIRIGYILTPELFEKYGMNMTAEEAAYEASRAVAPFEFEFTQVDWHSVYGIGQGLAARLQDRERILIAGDAAHTHSSGSGQGMNTGMHDAFNLGWRLAGVLKGWYKQEVLANYSEERHAIAEFLINYDRIVSVLIAGHKPESLKDRPETTGELLEEYFNQQTGFTNGLTISYPENLLNDVSGSSLKGTKHIPGERGPDAMVEKIGKRGQMIRLFEAAKNDARFHVLVLAGSPKRTVASLQKLRAQVDQEAAQFAKALKFVTVIAGRGYAVDENLGVRSFGTAYWDVNESAHSQYGVSTEEGALIVLRPDGYIGQISRLDDFEGVSVYLRRLMHVEATQDLTSRNQATKAPHKAAVEYEVVQA